MVMFGLLFTLLQLTLHMRRDTFTFKSIEYIFSFKCIKKNFIQKVKYSNE